MTNADRGPFAELMIGAGEVFNEVFSDAKMELYFAALADLELPEIRAALNTHVRVSKFFPRPAEIRESVLGSTEDRAELAWVKLLSLVRSRGWTNPPIDWEDAAMRRAALELYGGWQTLCERLPGEGAGLAVAAKQFKATYVAHVRDGIRAMALPPTREEATAVLDGLKRELDRRNLPTGVLSDGR